MSQRKPRSAALPGVRKAVPRVVKESDGDETAQHIHPVARDADAYERRLFQFLSEQHAAKISQLTRAFGVYRADMERVVAELQAEGLVKTKQFLAGDDVWVWLTPNGDRLSETGFRTGTPHYRSLAHWGAITDTRIFVESRTPDAEWVCERLLRREQGGKPKGYLPDAVVIRKVADENGKEILLRYAIEVELSAKPQEDLEDKISTNEAKYDRVIYFAVPDICRRFHRLRLIERHARLRIYQIPPVNRALDQFAWRVPGDPRPLAKGERVDYGAIELSELERNVIDFVLEQGEVPMDQLESFFDLEADELEYVVSHLAHLRTVERSKPLVDEPPWVWVTRVGAHFSATGLKARTPSLSGLERVRAVNEIRILLTKDKPNVQWVSSRTLRQSRKKKGAEPGGAIKIGSELHAVEVLLFVKGYRSMHDLMARRFEEGFGAVLWFFSNRSGWQVRKFWRELPSKYQQRLKTLPLPPADHLLMIPGKLRGPKARRGSRRVTTVQPVWGRLARQAPVRLRRMAIDSVRPEALQVISAAAKIDRPPVVLEAWVQRRSNGVRWLVTDVGFFRVVHSSWGTRADEVESEDVFVKEEGPEIKVSWNPAGPGRRRGSQKRTMVKPEKYEMDDRAWAMIDSLISAAEASREIIGAGGQNPLESRAVVSGAIWRLRNDANWASIPHELGYGSGAAVQGRLRRWQAMGVWDEVVDVLERELPDGRRLEWWRLESRETRRKRGFPVGSIAGFKASPPRHEIDNAVWSRIEPIFGSVQAQREGRPWRADRGALSGVIWRLRKRAFWSEIPLGLGYGTGELIRARLREWEAFGIWEEVRKILEAELPDGRVLPWKSLRPHPVSARKQQTSLVQPRRYEMEDAVWARIEPIIGSLRERAQGQPPAEDRGALNGVIWRLRNRAAWSKIPEDLGYGAGEIIRTRLREWEAWGIWDEIRRILEAELPDGRSLPWRSVGPAQNPTNNASERVRILLAKMEAEPEMKFTYSDYQRLTGASKNAVHSDLAALADAWLVIGTRVGSSRECTFSAPRDLAVRRRLLEATSRERRRQRS